MDRRTRARVVAVVLAGVLVLTLVGGLLQGGGGDDTSTPTTPAPVATTTPRHSDLPVVLVADLPREALETIALVAQGGPYPYEQDGSTFANREGLLPPAAEGYYQEFTVPTPGSPDRGARRIVVGGDGEVYFTNDHYQSFSEVVGDG